MGSYLCLLCLIFFNYVHQNIHNNSNFAMISVIQLVIMGRRLCQNYKKDYIYKCRATFK